MKHKLFCTRPRCDDPFCDRHHHYECVICFDKVDEDEAVWTRLRGYAHAACLLQDFNEAENLYI